MPWQKIVDAFYALPSNQRTSLCIASQLQAGGYEVPPHQVKLVIRSTVLPELLTAEELVATARVLQTLLDLTVQTPRSGNFHKSIAAYASSVTDGLGYDDPQVVRAVSDIREALAYAVLFYLETEQANQAVRKRDTRSRYAVDIDLPF